MASYVVIIIITIVEVILEHRLWRKNFVEYENVTVVVQDFDNFKIFKRRLFRYDLMERRCFRRRIDLM